MGHHVLMLGGVHEDARDGGEIMTVTMDARIKGLWLDALRSGKYKQGVGVLKYIDAGGTATHCCLGVLCEVAVNEGAALVHARATGDQMFVSGDDESYATLPDGVMQWAGIKGMGRSGHDLDEQWDVGLAVMNDGVDGDPATRMTFPQIADFIEANIEGV